MTTLSNTEVYELFRNDFTSVYAHEIDFETFSQLFFIASHFRDIELLYYNKSVFNVLLIQIILGRAHFYHNSFKSFSTNRSLFASDFLQNMNESLKENIDTYINESEMLFYELLTQSYSLQTHESTDFLLSSLEQYIKPVKKYSAFLFELTQEYRKYLLEKGNKLTKEEQEEVSRKEADYIG